MRIYKDAPLNVFYVYYAAFNTYKDNRMVKDFYVP